MKENVLEPEKLNYDNALKLTGGQLNVNINAENTNYRSVPPEYDYSCLPITFKDNAKGGERSNITLFEALVRSTHTDHRNKCMKVTKLLYNVELEGYDGYEDAVAKTLIR